MCKPELNAVDRVRCAIDRLVWSDIEFHLWRVRYGHLFSEGRQRRKALKLKAEAIVLHDRVLTERE